MSAYTVYNLKIKIISIHFRIRAINGHIQFQLYMGQKLLDKKEIAIKHGLIVENATLQCEISQFDLESDKQMEIVLTEKNKAQHQRIGNIIFSSQEFKNIKMRKFHVDNCFDKSAYLEAFLLLLPTRCVEQRQKEEQNRYEQLTNHHLYVNLAKIMFDNSDIRIRIDEEKQESEVSYDENNQQQQQITFNEHDRIKTESVNANENIDIGSLITLNDILNEANQQLTIENQQLKQLVADLHQQQRLQVQIAQDRQSQLKRKYDEIESKLRQKQIELCQKCEQIEKIRSSAEKQLAQMTQSLKSELKEQLRMNSLIIDLGNCTDTSRYKRKADPSKSRSSLKLTPLPRIPILTLTKESFFKEGSKTSRSQRNRSKSITMSKCKQVVKHDETLDTMKQINSVLSVK